MLFDFLYILAGLVLLIAGAEFLVRGASAIALRLGISSLVVGLTIVAFGTSSPELVVSLRATLSNQPEVALGTVVGSNICNILLILGIAAMLRPVDVHRQIIKTDLPIMIGCSLLLAGILATGGVTRLWGALLFSGLISYIAWTVIQARRGKATEAALLAKDEVPEPTGKMWIAIVFTLSGPLMLSFGSDWMLKGAINLAERLEISKAIIGLTVVAVGGSLPELATAVVAALKGKGDLVVGNIVGSNIFNILSILGLASLARPLPFDGHGVQWSDVYVMLAAALGCLLICALPLKRDASRVNRLEGGILLTAYAAYIFSLVS